MKQYLGYMLVVACALMVLVGCGGGGGGGEVGNSIVASENPSMLLRTEDAEVVAMAITGAVVDAFQTIEDASAESTNRGLKALKEVRSFIGTATGRDGGTCELTGSGDSDLSTDPLTVSLSGELMCYAYMTWVSTPEGEIEMYLNGPVSVSMSGAMTPDYSSGSLDFALDWSALFTIIDYVSYSSLGGSYALSLQGNDAEMAVTENGTIGGQEFSQVRTITNSYSTAVYDYYTDEWVVYTNPSLYHGDYVKDESVNRDTCSNNFHPYVWSNIMNIAELDETSVRFVENQVSTVFVYDGNYPHFDGYDTLRYWYDDSVVACVAGIGSLPSGSTAGYEDVIIFACSDGVDSCALDYTRENMNAIKTVKAGAADPLHNEMVEKLKSELQDEVKDLLNSR